MFKSLFGALLPFITTDYHLNRISYIKFKQIKDNLDKNQIYLVESTKGEKMSMQWSEERNNWTCI